MTQPVPLYAVALSALGLLEAASPQRRSVRRDGSEDVLDERDESTFARTDAPEPRRRRRPTGTAVR